MNLIDLVGKNIKLLILGQYQESLSPELYMKGKLIGVDQSIYLIETDGPNGEKRVLCVPLTQCILSTQ
jgi:hypothetical protein